MMVVVVKVWQCCWDGEGDGDALCASDDGEDDRWYGDNIVDGYFMVLTLIVM